MEKESFINILNNSSKNNINNKYNNYFDHLSNNIENIPNILFYGPPGVGKYSESLKFINKYSPSNLKYEKKLFINSIKNDHFIKISDIHYEINIENLTCNPKILFNDIYKNILDCIESSNTKAGILLLKNFHFINNELLDIIYSYMQKIINNNIIVKFIIITENISFIPKNILDIFKILYYSKLSISNYIKLSNSKNKNYLLKLQKENKIENSIENYPNKLDYFFNNIENINILKHIDLENNSYILNTKKSICDNLVNIIINNKLNYVIIRNNLYDILIYNLNVYECIFYIIENIILQHNKKFSTDFLDKLYFKTCEFLKYYNNNYRPIYHLESYILYIIKELHYKKNES